MDGSLPEIDFFVLSQVSIFNPLKVVDFFSCVNFIELIKINH